MRAKVLLSLVGATIAAVALVSASGAATTKAQKVTRIDVSTRAAVIHYLRSIHVNPTGAVIQRGALNYAGARCPGGGWSCASTRHTVVQIAKRGGQNRFVCRSSKCVVVQLSGVSRGVYIGGRTLASNTASKGNTAVCVKTGSGATTGGGQTCSITQTAGGPNLAGVYENTNKVSGLTQTAQYNATITQLSSGSNGNKACVTQNVSLDGSASNTNTKPVTVSLNAFQTILIKQNSPSGPNSAEFAADATGACTTQPLTQSQTLTSTVTTKGSIMQSQDTALTNPSGTPAANLVTEIDQNQALTGSSGLNRAAFIQTSNQTAIANTQSTQTFTPTVTQQQDANVPNPPYSGIVGTLNQDSSAKSTASATQNETQCEDAVNTALPNSPAQSTCDQSDADAPTGITLNQTQYGPEGIFTPPTKHSGRRVPYNHKGYGASRQTGNPDCLLHNPADCDVFTLSQTSTQNTDNGPHTTQSNIIQGDCTSIGGSCDAGQTATLNGQDTSDGYIAGTITGLTITCSNGHSSCQPTPPPAPTLTGEPPTTNYSSSGTFSWTDAATGGITFKCKLDTGTFSTTNCASGVSFFQGYGPHSFQVEAVDNSGNVGGPTAEYDWTNVPPTPTIDSGPADQSTSNSPEASFTFSDSSDTSLSFVCSLDGAAYTACSSGQTYTGLADGSHTFSVEATDGANHFSAAVSRAWTVQVFTWNAGMTQLTATNVDIGEFGYGGMRGSGTGSINVSGLSGKVLRAYLYWNGPTNSTDPNSNANVTFNTHAVTGTNIGTASDNNWGFLNGQSYRADVTSLVNGNGTYSLSNFLNANADINGVSLIVFYDDGNTANDRNIVLWNGNDSNVGPGPAYAPDGWDETLTSVPYPGTGSASLDLVVSDGQSFDDDALKVNGMTVASAGAIFSGDSVPANSTESSQDGGSLWDIKSFPIDSELSAGSNNSLEVTTGTNQDALSLVVAIANTPVVGTVSPASHFAVPQTGHTTTRSKQSWNQHVGGGVR